jgi:hypothetical protein
MCLCIGYTRWYRGVLADSVIVPLETLSEEPSTVEVPLQRAVQWDFVPTEWLLKR